ncbi:kinase-like domain-containing protein, partial [Hygrophoropsis aurantiaca]
MQLVRVDGRFRIKEKLGSGACGHVYRASNIIDDNEVVVKIDVTNPGRNQSTLAHEYEILDHLRGGVGIPHPLWFGREANCDTLILDHLGPSLEEVFNAHERKFTLGTVAHIADQLICRLEYVHSFSYVHRDIKPQNVLTGGPNNPHIIYLVDFSHAKEYRDPRTNAHVPYCQN